VKASRLVQVRLFSAFSSLVYPATSSSAPSSTSTLDMKLVPLLLLALAALCASAANQDTCAWDMIKMVTFQADDALVAVSLE
jgi:hypothetical protein